MTLTLSQAERLVADALTRNATCVARALVAAEVDGPTEHGLSRGPSYAAQAKVGKVDGFALPNLERRGPGVAVFDAASGFAFPAIAAAVEALPAMARTVGAASAVIFRSHHCGAAGHPAERLAEQGLVATMFANTPARSRPRVRRPTLGSFSLPLPPLSAARPSASRH